MSVVRIPGVTPSQQLRDELHGETVILAFSRGKDSIAAWLALREAGVEVLPYHMYLVPELRFVDESLAYFADFFGCGPILNLPHPSLYRWLDALVYQPPERCAVIDQVGIYAPEYTEINPMVREHFGLPPDTPVCNGVRAADSPNRRMAVKVHGPVNEKAATTQIVWDWKIADVRAAIAKHSVQLPPDYKWFGRSFDGIDARFTSKLKLYAPDDYERVLSWFPFADLDLYRATL
jgi:hypothetical protein